MSAPRVLSTVGRPFGRGAPGAQAARDVLPGALVLALGTGLAAVVAIMVAGGSWPVAAAVTVAMPLVVILVRYPFFAFVLWALVLPFFMRRDEGVALYWIFHRMLIPGTLALVLVTGTGILRGRNRFRFRLADGAILAYLIVVVFNTLVLTDRPMDGLIRFYDRYLVPVSAYFLVRLIAPGKAELRWLVPLAIGTIVVQSLVGALSWVAPSTLLPEWTELAGLRTVGTLGNPNLFSSVLVFSALILFDRRTEAGRVEKWLIRLMLGLAVLFVFLSFARASWLAGSLVLLALIIRQPRAVLPWVIPTAAIAALAGATVLAASVAFAADRLGNEETAGGRIIGDVASIRMMVEKPLTGWGYDTYNKYWEQFKSRVEEIAVPDGVNSGTSHNAFLTIGAETGLPSLLLYVSASAWWLAATIRNRRRLAASTDPVARLVPLLWLSILFIFVVGNFMDMFRFNPFGTTLWWLAHGLIAVAVDPLIERRRPSVTSVPIWRRVGSRSSEPARAGLGRET